MTITLRPIIAGMLCVLAAATTLQAQDTDRLRVFIDCSFYCDQDFLRTELTWVDYMRDRADAQVHVLVTRQSTAAGGGEFTLEFIGLRQFTGRADTLRYTSGPNDASDIVRRGLARVISLGLVPYVANTPIGQRLAVSFTAPQATPGAAATPAAPQNDPWNFWTFRIGMNGNSSGESQQGFDYLSGNITANRTTEAWKINLSTNGSYNESRFEYTLSDGETRKTKSVRRNYGANTLIVKSITPHLSIGGRAGASTSTFGNTKLSVSLSPAIEYNFMPYSESTRRSLLINYSPGWRFADYREITIYDQLEESRPIHSLGVNYSTRQPWGSVSIGASGSQYLHDTSKYNAGIGGSTDIRMFRGLSFNVGGNYSHVRDQLALAARNLTEEEILLRQRQLATNYNYYIFGGISYRFGSIFNNVVNPRMGGGGGDMIIMM